MGCFGLLVNQLMGRNPVGEGEKGRPGPMGEKKRMRYLCEYFGIIVSSIKFGKVNDTDYCLKVWMVLLFLCPFDWKFGCGRWRVFFGPIRVSWGL